MGGEWLPITEFSRNQRKLIDHQVGRGGRVDTANSGMICRHHTTSTVREIRCELCQLIKPENEFSTNSKKSGDNVSHSTLLHRLILTPFAALPTMCCMGRNARTRGYSICSRDRAYLRRRRCQEARR